MLEYSGIYTLHCDVMSRYVEYSAAHAHRQIQNKRPSCIFPPQPTATFATPINRGPRLNIAAQEIEKVQRGAEVLPLGSNAPDHGFFRSHPKTSP